MLQIIHWHFKICVNGLLWFIHTARQWDTGTNRMWIEPNGNLHRPLSPCYINTSAQFGTNHFLSVSVSVNVNTTLRGYFTSQSQSFLDLPHCFPLTSRLFYNSTYLKIKRALQAGLSMKVKKMMIGFTPLSQILWCLSLKWQLSQTYNVFWGWVNRFSLLINWENVLIQMSAK